MGVTSDYEQHILVRKQVVERAIIYPFVVLFWGGAFWPVRSDPIGIAGFMVFAGVTVLYAEFRFRQIEKGGITISVRNGVLEYFDSAHRRHFMMKDIVSVSGTGLERGFVVTLRNGNQLNLYSHPEIGEFLAYLKSQSENYGYEFRAD